VSAATRARLLRPGDVVGVCAPGGPVDPDRLARGLAAVRALGLEPKLAPHAGDRHLFLAGTTAARAEDLATLLADPEVKALWCARGGSGASQVLERIGVSFVRRHAKALIGYSDATVLHALWQRAGVPSIHGPMVAVELARGDADLPTLRHALFGEGTPYATEPGELRMLIPGRARGRLRAGCLTLLAAVAGTRWAVPRDPEGTVLVLEDVDEPPYKIDRLLWQLRASGALRDVRGIVFGCLEGCLPRPDAGYTIEDVLREALAPLGVPVALGLRSGHVPEGVPHVALPLGVPARLDVRPDSARLELGRNLLAAPPRGRR
jgi:muramoyltetrapeptide carboxypeptidase